MEGESGFMKAESTPEQHPDGGYTLVELIVALSVIAMVLTLSLSTLAFFNRVSLTFHGGEEGEESFRAMHLYFQKQIERSEKIYLKNGQVYLQDMESPKTYYNYYTLKSQMIYRNKARTSDLMTIGSGSTSQFSSGIESFSLRADVDGQGQLNGNLRLTVQFTTMEGNSAYEAVFKYPGGVNKMELKE